jgi:HAE1 family hydrophobic/amphiphilic exporter-1
VPLAIASGSGAVARKVMGTAVIGGMLTATCIAVFIIPALFYLVEKLTHRKDKGKHEPHKDPTISEGRI